MERADRSMVASARIATSGYFILFGLIVSLWFVHIPVVSSRLALEPAVLGLALLCIAAGALVGSAVGGPVIARAGSRQGSLVAMLAAIVCVTFLIAAWTTPVLFVAAAVLGVLGGLINVGINTQASEIETLRGRPTMSSFHGFWSVGQLAGASLGGAMIGLGWGNGGGAALVAVAMLAAALALATRMLPENQRVVPVTPPADRARRFAVPAAGALGFAALALLSNVAEGAVGDWSGLYLSTVRNLGEAVASTGLVLFAATMAVCRLLGGPVVARLGERTIVLGGGVLLATGIAVVVFAPWSWLSPAGFILVALGAANIAPVIYGVASRVPGVDPSAGIAAVSTAQTVGLLLGPPIIGFVAQGFGLPVGLGLLILFGAAIAIGAALRQWPAHGGADDRQLKPSRA